MFRFYSYTIIRECINALPDDGITVTPKHVEAVLIYISVQILILFLRQLNGA